MATLAFNGAGRDTGRGILALSFSDIAFAAAGAPAASISSGGLAGFAASAGTLPGTATDCGFAFKTVEACSWPGIAAAVAPVCTPAQAVALTTTVAATTPTARTVPFRPENDWNRRLGMLFIALLLNIRLSPKLPASSCRETTF
jgi:hypothetical protein